nr:hypothetical protein [Tanacetum cinerariifolium]
MPEMFPDEHALDYSSPLIFDEYDDDFFEVKSDTENVYDDPFDFKGEKIKASKLLINKLDLPCSFLFLSEYDLFLSEDFSRVDALPSTNNEDKDLFSTNQPSGNPTFSSHLELTSPEVKDDIFDAEGGNVLPEKLLDLDSTKDLHPPLHVDPLSGSTTYSSSPNQLLEKFGDELSLITFPPEYDDDL